MNESVVRIDPQNIYPMHERVGQIAMQELQRADADGHEQKSFDELEERDQQESSRAVLTARWSPGRSRRGHAFSG